MTNQHHVMVLDKLEVSSLEYVSDKSDLNVEGILNIVPLRIGSMKMLHDEDSHNSGLRNIDDDNDVSDIPSNMLVEYQLHKEVNGKKNKLDYSSRAY